MPMPNNRMIMFDNSCGSTAPILTRLDPSPFGSQISLVVTMFRFAMALLWLLAVPAIAAKKNQSDGDDSVPWQNLSLF